MIIEKNGRINAVFEIKSSPVISGAHLSGFSYFMQENKAVPLYVIGINGEAYALDGLNILP